MNFSHKPVAFHFRQRLNPGTAQYFNFVASKNYARIETYKLLSKLEKLLKSRVTCLAAPNTFTLVNISNLMTGQSYGYAPSPTNVLQFEEAISFTFAINQQSDLHYTEPPIHVHRENREITFWGYSSPREYVTLDINVNNIVTTGLSIKDYEYMYLIVGAATKNFAMFKDVANHGIQYSRASISQFYTMYYALPLSELMYTVPYSFWIYNKNAWELIPETLPASAINSYSALYYAVFISTKVMTTRLAANIDGCKHLLNELYRYYVQSQKMLIGTQVGEHNVDEEHEYVTGFIYPTAIYCILHMLNTPGTGSTTGYTEWKPKRHLGDLFKYFNDCTVKVQEDINIHSDIQFLVQMPSLCRDAIVNKMDTFRKASIILGQQMAHETFTRH